MVVLEMLVVVRFASGYSATHVYGVVFLCSKDFIHNALRAIMPEHDCATMHVAY